MKYGMKKTAIALALGGLLASGTVLAQEAATTYDESFDFSKNLNMEENIKFENDVYVGIEKDIYVGKNVYLDFYVKNHDLDHAGVALIDNKQVTNGNDTKSDSVDNNAQIYESIFTVGGNNQLNTAAGENNQQDNAVAIAVDSKSEKPCEKDCNNTPPEVVGGAADAETFVFQGGHENDTEYDNVTNYAGFTGSLIDIAGNVQVNVAAGTNNQQKNSLAIAIADDALMAEATAFTLQESVNNYTDSYCVTNDASLTGSIGNAFGNVQVNVAAGVGNQQSNSLALATKAY